MLPVVLEGLGHPEFQQILESQHYPRNDQPKE